MVVNTGSGCGGPGWKRALGAAQTQVRSQKSCWRGRGVGWGRGRLGVGSCLSRMKGTVASSREVVAHFLHSEAFIGPRLPAIKMLGSRNSQESFPKTLIKKKKGKKR